MSGHARTAGKIFKEIEIGGKRYTLSQPALVGIYAEMEAFVISRKEDPIVAAERACKTAPPAMHATIWEAAMKAAASARIATAEEMAAFNASVWGAAFQLFKCLDPRHHDEIRTVEDAMRLLERAGEDRLGEIMRNVSVVSGEADMGNSSGPSTTRAKRQSKAIRS